MVDIVVTATAKGQPLMKGRCSECLDKGITTNIAKFIKKEKKNGSE